MCLFSDFPPCWVLSEEVIIILLLLLFAESEADAAVKAELSEETGLGEEDLVAVSYDELDLETVGDIIAIIEEKVLKVKMLALIVLSVLTTQV